MLADDLANSRSLRPALEEGFTRVFCCSNSSELDMIWNSSWASCCSWLITWWWHEIADTSWSGRMAYLCNIGVESSKRVWRKAVATGRSLELLFRVKWYKNGCKCSNEDNAYVWNKRKNGITRTLSVNVSIWYFLKDEVLTCNTELRKHEFPVFTIPWTNTETVLSASFKHGSTAVVTTFNFDNGGFSEDLA